jgi:hypothetical protein
MKRDRRTGDAQTRRADRLHRLDGRIRRRTATPLLARRALPPIRTLTVGPGISPGQPVTGGDRVADYNRRFGLSPTPECAAAVTDSVCHAPSTAMRVTNCGLPHKATAQLTQWSSPSRVIAARTASAGVPVPDPPPGVARTEGTSAVVAGGSSDGVSRPRSSGRGPSAPAGPLTSARRRSPALARRRVPLSTTWRGRTSAPPAIDESREGAGPPTAAGVTRPS